MTYWDLNVQSILFLEAVQNKIRLKEKEEKQHIEKHTLKEFPRRGCLRDVF